MTDFNCLICFKCIGSKELSRIRSQIVNYDEKVSLTMNQLMRTKIHLPLSTDTSTVTTATSKDLWTDHFDLDDLHLKYCKLCLNCSTNLAQLSSTFDQLKSIQETLIAERKNIFYKMTNSYLKASSSSGISRRDTTCQCPWTKKTRDQIITKLSSLGIVQISTTINLEGSIKKGPSSPAVPVKSSFTTSYNKTCTNSTTIVKFEPEVVSNSNYENESYHDDNLFCDDNEEQDQMDDEDDDKSWEPEPTTAQIISCDISEITDIDTSQNQKKRRGRPPKSILDSCKGRKRKRGRPPKPRNLILTRGDKPFSNEDALDDLFKSTTTDTDLLHPNSLICTLCPQSEDQRVYKSQRTLRRHHQAHHEISSKIFCETCGKSISKVFYKKHRLAHEEQDEILAQSRDKDFKCSFCEKGFYGERQLGQHVYFVHQRSGVICFKCGKNIKNIKKHLLNVHKIGAVKKATCEICHKEFKSKDYLRSHMIAHDDSRPFACTFDSCDKAFKSKSDLNNHTNIHTKLKSEQCEFCQKEFIHPYNLRMHLATIHSDQRKIHCEIEGCQESFQIQKQLDIHMRKDHT